MYVILVSHAYHVMYVCDVISYCCVCACVCTSFVCVCVCACMCVRAHVLCVCVCTRFVCVCVCVCVHTFITHYNFISSTQTGGSAPDEVKPDIVKKVCKVCSDNASGNHFGVMTCEACKSFFRRSIRASAKYYCNNHNACIIDKRNRNRCQACRLRKCLDVGMQPDCEFHVISVCEPLPCPIPTLLAPYPPSLSHTCPLCSIPALFVPYLPSSSHTCTLHSIPALFVPYPPSSSHACPLVYTCNPSCFIAQINIFNVPSNVS